MGRRFYYAGRVRTTKVALFIALVSSTAIAASDPDGPPPPPPLTVAEGEPAQKTWGGMQVPMFSKGGILFSIEFGPGAWAIDTVDLAAQLGAAAPLADMWARGLRTSYSLGLRFGYNILGVATVEFAFAGSGWLLSDPNRGGGGFAGGVVRFHPLEIVWRVLKKEQRPFGLDFSMYWGWGYGIAGFGADPAMAIPALGMDGFAFQWGFDVEYFFTKGIGVSLGLRGAFPFWNKLYVDFENRVGFDVRNGIKGAYWAPTIGILMRSGE